MAFEFIQGALEARRQAHLFRQRYTLPSGHGRFLVHQGRQYLNFSSNDYLAMAAHPQVVAAAKAGLDQCGVGSSGSPLVTGYSQGQQALEEYLADWLGFDRCLLFTSGFAANNGILQTLLTQKSDLVIQDKLNHASLLDGGLHCQGQNVRYRHNDLAHLQQKLATLATHKLVVTEGVFSMDGDSAPLAAISQHCQNQQAWLMVDDAHGLGVMGANGKGTLAQQGVGAGVNILMATFGKAVGTQGAFVAANHDTIEYLIQHCRHYIYSTAMPSAMAQATLASVKLIDQDDERREKLQALINHFKQRMTGLPLAANHSVSPIQPLIIGSPAKALAISAQLKAQGIWLTAIRPPTVPVNTARLRVTLTSGHELADIDQLFDCLEPLL